MEIKKRYSHKNAEKIFSQQKQGVLTEVELAIQNLNAIACLTKETKESSKIRRWGGLLFSPPTINKFFRKNFLEPNGWLEYDAERDRYKEPAIRFPSETTINNSARYRKMDGLKDRVGLEMQLGKYAFMGYDIFSKMIIFKNKNLIDLGLEIVLVQEMIDCMSTGVSAFEHIMIDFEYRGEADIDIPVLVLGIGPTKSEWDQVFELQELYRQNPQEAKVRYPAIGTNDLPGEIPGPK